VLGRFDIDDLTRLICPRPLGIFAGDTDRYAHDAQAIIDTTRQHYRAAEHEDRLHGDIATGGHALTPHRSRSITDWVIRTACGT
jgi:hypothetical protein